MASRFVLGFYFKKFCSQKLEEFDELIAESIALRVAQPLATIARIGLPFVWLLDVSVRKERVTRCLAAVNPDFDEPIGPMMLGNMRQLGVRWLAVEGRVA